MTNRQLFEACQAFSNALARIEKQSSLCDLIFSAPNPKPRGLFISICESSLCSVSVSVPTRRILVFIGSILVADARGPGQLPSLHEAESLC